MISRMMDTTRFALGENADQYTVAALRIFLFSAWAIRFGLEPLSDLGFLDPALFTHQGLMILVPHFVIAALTSPAALLIYKVVLVGALVAAAVGIKPKASSIIALALLTFTIGFMKGYGGHVNHRELTLLYCGYLLPFLPVYEVWCVNKQPATEDKRLYQFTVLALCLIVVLQYVFVGLARVCMGSPAVFHPETMWGWIINHAMRMNPLGSPVGVFVLETPILKYMMGPAIFLSTILELLAPCMFFIRQNFVRIFVVAFVGFHLSIFATMNILFLENMLALVFFFDLAYFFRPSHAKA